LDYRKHVEFFFLSLICGIATVGITFVARMNDNVLQTTVAIREIVVRMEAMKNESEYRFHILEEKTRHLK